MKAADRRLAFALLILASPASLAAQTVGASDGRAIADVGLGIPFPLIGKLQPRHARDIPASNWSIGGETLDRDYAVYENYKQYLGPLGAKQIRLQGGWAKTEKQKGVYDFEWLDRIITDAASQGVHPWIQLSYGNPLYPGGGSANLHGGLPSSQEALQAWDRWVLAMVERYHQQPGVVWEIWNEPDIDFWLGTAEQYATLWDAAKTAIKEVQPQALVMNGGFSEVKRRPDFIPTWQKTSKQK
ncbi:MAG: beta-galactosidase, partial [Gemmatimonadetes bacterium]|nr:beta-galactosidase [Gemmatimonadota bacterium]